VTVLHRSALPATSERAKEAEAAQNAVLQATVAAPGEAGLAEVAARVAGAVAMAEPEPERAQWSDRFAAQIAAGTFLPAVPALSNAGRSGQLAPCFVLEPEDSLDSIYATLHRAARIQQGSGGVGVHFSRLRPKDTPIQRSGGVSPGPMAFIELFAHSARVNALSGRRPGAHLAILRGDHPDIVEFVRARSRQPETLAGVGFAVALPDALLEAAASAERAPLRNAAGGSAGSVSARDLLREIADAIRATGEPTLLFLEAIEAGNPAPHLGAIAATNPCGEQPLLPGESCVLGSLHLPAFSDADGSLDLERLADAARDGVRFLDDVVEANRYPDGDIARKTRGTRKVGLGLMGFADWLLLRGVDYGSAESERLASEVMGVVARAARAATEALAEERGAYPAWRGPGKPRRNACVLAVAPTGTLRLIAGCNGGMEPFLQPILEVRTSASAMRWIDPWIEAWLADRTPDPRAVLSALENEVASSELPDLAAADRRLLRRAWEIPPEEQIDVQARFQEQVDGAVSKTVHLAGDVPSQRIIDLIERARQRCCKGVSFYWHDAGARPPAVSLYRESAVCVACDVEERRA
jgi:ribonucleoside-diphosphate reductase alpha chain